MGWLMPNKRPTDNMELAPDLPQEEEGRRLKFALDIVRREQPDAAVAFEPITLFSGLFSSS